MVVSNLTQVTSTPTIDTAIYAAGDQVGPAATVLTNALLREACPFKLSTLVVTDSSKQKSALDIFIWGLLPAVTSVDNGPFALTSAELVAKCIGVVSIATTDWKDTNAQTVAIVKDINLLMRGLKGTSNPYGTSIWYTIVSRGTPTYATTTALTLTFRFE